MIASFKGPYAFLSNFYPSPILYGRIVYPTAEHLFQALKTEDDKERRRIAQLDSPGQARRAGRAVILRKDWHDIRYDAMQLIVDYKFSQNTELAERLLNTGDLKIVEGNTWGDTYWGCCDGVGANHLGKILMKKRDSLSKEGRS